MMVGEISYKMKMYCTWHCWVGWSGGFWGGDRAVPPAPPPGVLAPASARSAAAAGVACRPLPVPADAAELDHLWVAMNRTAPLPRGVPASGQRA